VRHEPRRGCFVNQVTEQDLDEIFPVIALLEGPLRLRGRRNATDADLLALEALHDTAATATPKPGRITEYYAANFGDPRSHHHAGQQPLAGQVITDLRKIVKLARLQQLHAPGRLEQSLTEHMAVFAALKARDAEGAEAAMRTHLTRQRVALRELARNQESASGCAPRCARRKKPCRPACCAARWRSCGPSWTRA
jgi:DNA-binding GntR family transcriptional regulator